MVRLRPNDRCLIRCRLLPRALAPNARVGRKVSTMFGVFGGRTGRVQCTGEPVPGDASHCSASNRCGYHRSRFVHGLYAFSQRMRAVGLPEDTLSSTFISSCSSKSFSPGIAISAFSTRFQLRSQSPSSGEKKFCNSANQTRF